MWHNRGTEYDYHIGLASPAFVSNVRRLLQVKSAVHYSHGHKEGKMARSRLYRAGLPPVDGGDWNARVFKRKTQESDVLDTAILILTDWSGSMSGTKAQHAAKATGLVNEAFANQLHMPVEILAFSCHSEVPTIGVIKSFGKKASPDQIANRFYTFLSDMSGNNDADSLAYAYSRILKRREKRKILIVMSDGSPADGIGDPYHALKEVTSRIEAEGKVDLYGLGIMDRNVTEFYKKNVVIDRGASLEQGLIALLSKALT